MDDPVGFRPQADFRRFLERAILSGKLELPDQRVNALETATSRHARQVYVDPPARVQCRAGRTIQLSRTSPGEQFNYGA